MSVQYTIGQSPRRWMCSCACIIILYGRNINLTNKIMTTRQQPATTTIRCDFSGVCGFRNKYTYNTAHAISHVSTRVIPPRTGLNRTPPAICIVSEAADRIIYTYTWAPVGRDKIGHLPPP